MSIVSSAAPRDHPPLPVTVCDPHRTAAHLRLANSSSQLHQCTIRDEAVQPGPRLLGVRERGTATGHMRYVFGGWPNGPLSPRRHPLARSPRRHGLARMPRIQATLKELAARDRSTGGVASSSVQLTTRLASKRFE